MTHDDGATWAPLPSQHLGVRSIQRDGKDRIFVGQLKKDPFIAKGFWVWAVADNLTVGSALNAHGIARALFGDARRET